MGTRIDYYVSGEDMAHWPCPWITPDGLGCSSRPQPWPLEGAREWVNKNNRGLPLGKRFRVYRKRGKAWVVVE